MASNNKEVAIDLSPAIKVFKDGTWERMYDSPYVPPSPEDPTTGVSSKDISIAPHLIARLYLPAKLLTDVQTQKKLPILVYFHGGGFCVGLALSSFNHRFMNSLVSKCEAIAVVVKYRIAPEHPLPVAYEDCWESLQWVASHYLDNNNGADMDPWLNNYGDFNRVYIGGDSAGGNIVHNIAMRAGVDALRGDMKILGAFLSFPFLWGSKPIGSEESKNHEEGNFWRLWNFVYPSAPGGIENPMINPFVVGGPSLSKLGCSRLLVIVAEKDTMRDGGLKYYEAVKESGWKGELAELIDVEGEDHGFHIYVKPKSEEAEDLIRRIASFIK